MVSAADFQRSPVFGDLSPAALEALAQRARSVEFRRHERIAPLINPPRRLVLIQSGLAKLSAATVNGHERIVYVYRPGDLVGSRVFLPNSAEAAYEVVAMSPVRGASIDLNEIQALGHDHPEALIAVTAAFSRRLQRLTDRLMGAMTEDVSVRICRLLLDFVGQAGEETSEFVPLEHPLTHETMANIVGASRPHTSSLLADLQEIGAVRRDRRSLMVRPKKLAEIVKWGRIEGEPAVSV